MTAAQGECLRRLHDGLQAIRVFLDLHGSSPERCCSTLRSAGLAVALVDLLEIGIDDVGSGITAPAIATLTGCRSAGSIAHAGCCLRHPLQCLADALGILAFHR